MSRDLDELQTRAARLAAAPGIDRGSLAAKVRELITAAYNLGRADREREVAMMEPAERARVLSLARHPSALPLSDDDSEAEADAAEARAQFSEPHELTDLQRSMLRGEHLDPGFRWPSVDEHGTYPLPGDPE
jgi:hypothetical protein